jgi:hypothetical protein
LGWEELDVMEEGWLDLAFDEYFVGVDQLEWESETDWCSD